MKEDNKRLHMEREIYVQMQESYGTRRMAKALRDRGIDCGRNRARTLMRMCRRARKAEKEVLHYNRQ